MDDSVEKRLTKCFDRIVPRPLSAEAFADRGIFLRDERGHSRQNALEKTRL